MTLVQTTFVYLLVMVDLVSFELMDEEDLEEARLLHKPHGEASLNLAWLKYGTRIEGGRLHATYQYLVNLN